MTLVYGNANFVVEAAKKPHIDRDDGGHIIISLKSRVADRQQLTPRLAIELMRLTIVVGQAMTTVMNKRGVDIGRINYQDNGNWSVLKAEGPHLHYHLYGRAKSAKINKYGEACYFPNMATHPEYYKNFKPLNDGDVKEIRREITRLLSTEKYRDSAWGLSSARALP